jgi:hypothetical protein
MAQAKESKMWVVPPIETSNALSYVLPQVSQVFMPGVWCKERAVRRARFVDVEPATK